jgi:hypothetical protein
MVRLHRASNRNRRLKGLLHHRRHGRPETGERAVHFGNQSRELVGSDLVMPHVAADNEGDLIEVDPWWWRVVFCIVSVLLLFLVSINDFQIDNYFVCFPPTKFSHLSECTLSGIWDVEPRREH